MVRRLARAARKSSRGQEGHTRARRGGERPRREIEWLFRLAEDSETRLRGYLDRGQVWVALAADGAIVGHVQAVRDPGGARWEVLTLAVAEQWRGVGIGRGLLEHAVAEARRAGAQRIELATATADIDNLRFYQRCGFRMSHVVRDAFTPDTGYPESVDIDGIPLRDQIWFDREL
ncbi:GNAT family N-acetyltransferase [Nocardia thailandica]|uniref:GNAT family N-acetyltransferase n=1 Tax=Nocardia thailandica TaxID=257275 RepID=UPI0012F9168F|nr:GNAT family N-acetyltransferase [Nocardia thailandica]